MRNVHQIIVFAPPRHHHQIMSAFVFFSGLAFVGAGLIVGYRATAPVCPSPCYNRGTLRPQGPARTSNVHKHEQARDKGPTVPFKTCCNTNFPNLPCVHVATLAAESSSTGR
eukprot:145463-Amphidinium_carterae.1